MTAQRAIETYRDMIEDYADAGIEPSKQDRVLVFALYLLAEEGEYYGTVDGMLCAEGV